MRGRPQQASPSDMLRCTAWPNRRCARRRVFSLKLRGVSGAIFGKFQSCEAGFMFFLRNGRRHTLKERKKEKKRAHRKCSQGAHDPPQACAFGRDDDERQRRDSGDGCEEQAEPNHVISLRGVRHRRARSNDGPARDGVGARVFLMQRRCRPQMGVVSQTAPDSPDSWVPNWRRRRQVGVLGRNGGNRTSLRFRFVRCRSYAESVAWRPADHDRDKRPDSSPA